MHTELCFLSSLLIGGMMFGNAPARAQTSIRAVTKPATESTNAFYVGSRSPLQPTPLIKLPVGTIRPEGWVRKQLQLQRDGFHGHLDEISRFVVKENNAWLDPSLQRGFGAR